MSRKLGHQPMQPRLRAEARRACRHLRDKEDIEAFRAHGSLQAGRLARQNCAGSLD